MDPRQEVSKAKRRHIEGKTHILSWNDEVQLGWTPQRLHRRPFEESHGALEDQVEKFIAFLLLNQESSDFGIL